MSASHAIPYLKQSSSPGLGVTVNVGVIVVILTIGRVDVYTTELVLALFTDVEARLVRHFEIVDALSVAAYAGTQAVVARRSERTEVGFMLKSGWFGWHLLDHQEDAVYVVLSSETCCAVQTFGTSSKPGPGHRASDLQLILSRGWRKTHGIVMEYV